MINLSNAKVGDKYFDSTQQIMTLEIIGHSDYNYVFKYENGDYTVLDVNGKGQDHSHCNVSKKIDKRPWLKDMPDAGIFSDNVESLYMSESGCWFYRRLNAGYNYEISGALKMPTLTGDQWKDSEIRIKELREWQSKNKGKS